MDRSELELRYETMLEEYPDTKIIFSEGAAEQFAELMNAEKASSVVIFTGSSKGAAAKAMPNLQNLMAYMNLDFRFYMDIPAEPAVTDVRDMVRMLEEEKPQFVAALGGGSVMDAAKAAYLSWQSGLDVTDLFGVNQATRKCPDRKFKRVICLPTTSGTGSEATPYSNIVDREAGVKKLIMEEQIIPEYAFVDPEYAVSMPKNLTLVTALDAMVHSIESILNRNAPSAHPHSIDWGKRIDPADRAGSAGRVEGPRQSCRAHLCFGGGDTRRDVHQEPSDLPAPSLQFLALRQNPARTRRGGAPDPVLALLSRRQGCKRIHHANGGTVLA